MFNSNSISIAIKKLSANRAIIDRVLKIAIAFGLLVFLIGYISPREIYTVFSTAKYEYLIYASLLSFVNIFLQAYKWKLVINLSLGKLPFTRVLRSYFGGVTSGLSTPAKVGQFIGRAIPLKEFNFFDVTIMSFIDGLVSFIIVAFFGSVSSILFYRTLNSPHFYIDVPLFITIVIIFVILTYLLFSNAFIVSLIRKKFKTNEKVIQKISIVDKFLNQSWRKKSTIFLVNTLYFFVVLLQFALLVNAFTNYDNYFQLMMIASLILLATTVILPFSFGALGVREGASTYLVGLVAISPAVGFNSSIALFIINVILPAIIGLILLIKKK